MVIVHLRWQPSLLLEWEIVSLICLLLLGTLYRLPITV